MELRTTPIDGRRMERVPDHERAAETEVTNSPRANKISVHRVARLRAVLPVIFIVAILIAPFLASFVRFEAGLVVMGAALTATAVLLRGDIGEMPARSNRLLQVLLACNVILAFACFVAAIVRLLLR
jgi:hypothetical protein